MENILFISSSLQRLIASVREALADYGFTLLSNPLRLEGNEVLIRRIFTGYFKTRYSEANWPFEEVSEALIDAFILQGESYYGYQSEVVNFESFRYLFVIDLIRNTQGHRYPGSNTDMTPKRKRQFQVFYMYMHLKFKKFNLSKEQIFQTFHTLVDWKYRFPLLGLDEGNSKDPVFLARYQDFVDVAQEMCALFNIPEQDFTFLSASLNYTLDYYAAFPDHVTGKRYVLFPPRDFYLIERFEEEFPTFYAIAKEKITQICIRREIDPKPSYLDDLLYEFFSSWPTLFTNLFDKFSHCRILVLGNSRLQGIHLAEEMKFQLHKLCTIEVYDKQTISPEELLHFDFDLFVTTKTLSFEIEAPIFYARRMNNSIDYDSLGALIDGCVNENKKKERQVIWNRYKAMQ